MALMPITASLIWPQHNVGPPDLASAPPQRASSASDWEKQLNAELQGSLTYQVIKLVLLKEKIGEENADDEPIESIDATAASSTEVDVAVEIEVAISVAVQVNIEWQIALAQTTEAIAKRSDPLVLDLAGNGIATTGPSLPALFDLNADGVSDQISNVQADDYFLALDKNGNGVIDNGAELFGDQGGDRNGFDALRRFDLNRDNIIDQNDPVFDSLRLLQIDQNGQRQITLQNAGMRSINLLYQQTEQFLTAGDKIAQTSGFTRDDGQQALIADVLLQYR